MYSPYPITWIPTGALAPGAKQADPNKATEYYISRSGGLAGTTMVSGPFLIHRAPAAALQGAPKADAFARTTGTTSHPAGGGASHLTPARHTLLLATFNKAQKTGSGPHWMPSMPLGEQYFRAPLSADKHPDGFSYTVLIPTGAVRPGVGQIDPNKIGTFFVERSGGFAGQTQFAGPFTLPHSGSALDTRVNNH